MPKTPRAPRMPPTPVVVRVLRYVPVDLHEPLTACLGLGGWLEARLEKLRSFGQRVDRPLSLLRG